jgi:hypothetical protein
VGKEEGILEEDFDLVDTMNDWVSQVGFPVVEVTDVKERVSRNLTLRSQRFLLNPAESSSTSWNVPVRISDLNGDNSQLVWTKGSGQSIVEVPSNQPYLINADMTGFYRVNYDLENWNVLVDALKNKNVDISPATRAMLYDDAFNLARAASSRYDHVLPYDIPLRMSLALADEDDFVPLYAGLNGLSYLDKMFRENDYGYGFFRQFAIELLANNYDRFGFQAPDDDEPLTVTLSRGKILEWACYLGQEDCVNSAMDLFSSWKEAVNNNEGNPIDPNLRSVVYTTAGQNGGEDAFNFLLARLEEPGLRDLEIRKLIKGLASAEDKDLLNQLLDLTLKGEDESPIRREDRGLVYSYMGGTKVGRRVAFAWAQTHYDEILSTLGAGVIPSLLRGFAIGAAHPMEVSELTAFTEAHREDLLGSVDELQEDAALARMNEKWIEDHFATILLFLQGSDPTDPTDPTPTDPTDPTNPTDPTDPTDPTNPTTTTFDETELKNLEEAETILLSILDQTKRYSDNVASGVERRFLRAARAVTNVDDAYDSVVDATETVSNVDVDNVDEAQLDALNDALQSLDDANAFLEEDQANVDALLAKYDDVEAKLTDLEEQTNDTLDAIDQKIDEILPPTQAPPVTPSSAVTVTSTCFLLAVVTFFQMMQ